MSRIVRSKVEDELGKAEDKTEYLTALQNFISETPPPLEESSNSEDQNKESVKALMTEYETLRRTIRGNDGVLQKENGGGISKIRGRKIDYASCYNFKAKGR